MVKFKGEDTIKLNIKDDNRKVHSIIIKNVNYVPGDPI